MNIQTITFLAYCEVSGWKITAKCYNFKKKYLCSPFWGLRRYQWRYTCYFLLVKLTKFALGQIARKVIVGFIWSIYQTKSYEFLLLLSYDILDCSCSSNIFGAVSNNHPVCIDDFRPNVEVSGPAPMLIHSPVSRNKTRARSPWLMT